MKNSSRFIVVTGGPGSGKTTLIEALRASGFATSPEAGRGIIQDQQAIDGPALPWRNPGLFAELMLSWELRSYSAAKAKSGPVFFDRGIPDTVGYLRLSGLAVPAHMLEAARQHRYRPQIFITPPWPDIFKQDAERRQTWEEAERTHAVMVETYSGFGYELVTLPRAPVGGRVRFILAQIGVSAPQTCP
ncbi:ATPase [Mesorhizobium sp. Root157]|uniref:AAA family ATPase n=1 Tax=Mesorhizobium sp. Root157 TaxID=1736477 RepID=UPI0006FE5616|nr:AAA family ATPase [Mesorhizobium sp. Root157]KQZ81401.1 ATPase [Mesorhizobium sp. Root157]